MNKEIGGDGMQKVLQEEKEKEEEGERGRLALLFLPRGGV